MIIELKKGNTTMAISSLGAEPQSLVRDGIEYIWQGDREYWFRRAPGYTARAEVTAKEDLYYTFAWHPAFSLDINGRGCDLETYTLSFEQNEHLDRLYQCDGSYRREKDFLVGDSIDLTRAETDKGPMVFRNVRSREVTLTSSCGEHGVTAGLGDMTTFVAWTQQKRHGQFLCLEPMVSFGFADRPLEIERMEETRLLEKDHSEVWENTFTVF